MATQPLARLAPAIQPIARVVVIVNGAAGLASRKAARARLSLIETSFRAAGVAADIQVAKGRRVIELARAARDSQTEAVVAGGGDGTIGSVASQLVGSSKPLGILPLGTLNHFAKDLHVPLEIEAAVATIAAGHAQPVDVGEVNGHSFINNSSIGLYPQMVLRRDRQRLRLGRGKWLAMVEASLKVLRRFPLVHVRVDTGDSLLHRTTPILFVGNNKYEVEQFNIGGRARIDAGELSVYIATPTTRWGILLLALRTLLGRLRQARDFEELSLTEFRVETRKRRLHVALDGEVLTLRPPLTYRVRPRALRVLTPAPPEAGPA